MTVITNEPRWTGPIPTMAVETEPFWKACNNNQFLIQKCKSCSLTQYHYRAICSHCWSDDVEDLPINGTGTVWTFSVVEVNRSPQFREWGIYATGVVEISEGLKIITRIVSHDLQDLKIGDPVELRFALAENGQKVPYFEIVRKPHANY